MCHCNCSASPPQFPLNLSQWGWTVRARAFRITKCNPSVVVQALASSPADCAVCQR